MGAKGSTEQSLEVQGEAEKEEPRSSKAPKPLNFHTAQADNETTHRLTGDGGVLPSSPPKSGSHPPTPSPSNPPRLDALLLASDEPPAPASVADVQVHERLLVTEYKDADKVLAWTPNIGAPEFKPGGLDTIAVNTDSVMYDYQQQHLLLQQQGADAYDINMSYSDYGMMDYGGDSYTEYQVESQWLMAGYGDVPVAEVSSQEQWGAGYAATAYALPPEGEVTMSVPSPGITLATAPTAPQPISISDLTAQPAESEEKQAARQVLLKLCGAWRALGEQGSPDTIDRDTMLMYQNVIPRRRKPAEIRTLRAMAM
mmetsp:Transcript_38166/g.89519  ORF Transcript_38166/g.89519 Transcript_38166/m.89519 type:complete len:313 (-) Transcript_38166:81-1019(-)|eukprot:CAMPEP_0178411044 /NCGR_PEP_ID=MMETSP0689_2-20121128/21293_1 /TAXON_ID=160604 /ORGANISM="Amphidinium massartii, Strain CS-259" /LENGTH=312 /DNA_ID=CAMNT_0020032241 /DNA_START=181 /DNA_END=1119 /DNA_ORIENTATION=-